MGMKIDGVVVSCYKFDLQYTRLCVASVRFWYPEIPIWLVKDRRYGEFSTSEIERAWNVQIYPTMQPNQGWGFGKLEVMTQLPTRRFLFLDSDIVFAGRVIGRLERFDEDIIVDKEEFSPEEVGVQFFSLDKLNLLDPSFQFPGYGFNGGQIVATTGRLSQEDFDGLLDWNTRTVAYPEIFKKGDQGLTNYVVLRKVQQCKLSIRREPFMAWPGDLHRTAHIDVRKLLRDSPYEQVVHWAGLCWGKPFGQIPRSDILLHFENLYYSRIPGGRYIRPLRKASAWTDRVLIKPAKATAKQLLRKPM